jgi:hypothetical protein
MATAQHSLRISEARLRRHYFGGERAVIILALAAVLGVIFLIFGTLFLKLERRDNSIPTRGQVTDKYRRSEAQKTPEGETQLNYVYWVRYRYKDAASQPHEGKDTIDFADWDKLQKGDELTIEYQPTDPEKSKAAADHSSAGRRVGIFCLIVGTFVCAVTGLFGTSRWLGAHARVRRIREGTAVAGEIIERLPRPFFRFGDLVQYRLHYHFTDLAGARRSGKTPWLPRDVACRYAGGDPILVLCSPTAPWRHEADVFQVRTDDTV